MQGTEPIVVHSESEVGFSSNMIARKWMMTGRNWDPIVSVVIPTFGRADMLSRAVNSVLRQPFAQLEVIVVDDNDPETEARSRTQQIMKEFFETIVFLYLQHERNKNASAARNTASARQKANI